MNCHFTAGESQRRVLRSLRLVPLPGKCRGTLQAAVLQTEREVGYSKSHQKLNGQLALITPHLHSCSLFTRSPPTHNETFSHFPEARAEEFGKGEVISTGTRWEKLPKKQGKRKRPGDRNTTIGSGSQEGFPTPTARKVHGKLTELQFPATLAKTFYSCHKIRATVKPEL